MKIYLAQLNPTVGAIEANVARAAAAVDRGRKAGADLVVLPEMIVSGYPPRDLLEKASFVAAMQRGAERLAGMAQDVAVIFGSAEPTGREVGKPLYNAALLARHGRIVARAWKSLLPTYDVFDEERYFEPGPGPRPVPFGDIDLGLTVCEDIWNDKTFWKHPLYREDPVEELLAAGAQMIINISASPYALGKVEARLDMLRHLAVTRKCPVVYVNQVGGNDDIVFDGHSAAFDDEGRLVGACRGFEEDEVLVHIDSGREARFDPADTTDQVHAALVLGTRDYAAKCGFRTAVLGLSGGIDSAVTAAIAARALGPANVLGVSLPSRYSSQGAMDDAVALARNLGIGHRTIPIEGPFTALLESLRPVFTGRAALAAAVSGVPGGEASGGPPDVTEENLQARIRGTILMALSNKHGHLLLSTGNKSELAVGYCTLYGDMAGGLAVLSDCLKGRVYALARRINQREGGVIPESSIAKPPSAELRPDQTDQDSLPPYDVLDGILEAYVERGLSADDIVEAGYQRSTVARVVRMVDANEYKRKQAAPGLRVTRKAFGTGRRFPIVQGWREGAGKEGGPA